MVVAPKPLGQVRISVDLKKFNECVQRELHSLPHVEEILAQLTAQAFTKLNANSGFWQIPLARKLHLSLSLSGTVLTNCPLRLQVPQNYFSVI